MKSDSDLGAAPTTAQRVLRAAADLLRTGGVEALSTRAVAAAADVQPPTIYRQIGDKEDLLDAVTQFVLQDYLHDKRQILAASHDPLQDLRALWDLHVDFGLTHPDAYALVYGQLRPGRTAATAKETIALLQEVIARLGGQGRLCMGIERATRLVHAASVGVVLTLIPLPPTERDSRLSATARDNALSAILASDQRAPTEVSDLPARAVALGEAVRKADRVCLTAAERVLFLEWVDRLADQEPEQPAT
jgi:AcrR family transcriptional regulator